MSSLSLAQIKVQEIDGLLLVDSRLIADRLGIEHRTLVKTIEKYATELQGFGHLGFEIQTVTNSVGAVNTTKFVYLNEDQATLLLTMSRNTAQVVQCKVELVSAFKKAKALTTPRPKGAGILRITSQSFCFIATAIKANAYQEFGSKTPSF